MSVVQIRPVTSRDAGLALLLIGDDQLTGGAGGWSELSRPRRRAGLEWTGTPGFSYVLPLQLDGLGAAGDMVVEPQCATLLDWGVPTTATKEPPVLALTGPLKAPASVRWVIDNIEWGPCLRDDRDRRVQQNVTLTLKEYQRVAVLRDPAARSGKRG